MRYQLRIDNYIVLKSNSIVGLKALAPDSHWVFSFNFNVYDSISNRIIDKKTFVEAYEKAFSRL